MFGWKGFAFCEKATQENLNGKGIVWNLIQQWKPFVKYKATDFIDDAQTGEHKYTMDYVRCPEWVGKAMQRQLEWATNNFSGSTYLLKRTEDKTTGEITVDKIKKVE